MERQVGRRSTPHNSALHITQSSIGRSQTKRGGSIGNEGFETVNRSTADSAPSPHHHWQEESRVTARLGSPLGEPAQNGKTNDGYESIARKIFPGANCRNTRRAK